MKSNKTRNILIIATIVLVALAIAKGAGWIGSEKLIEVSVEATKKRDIVETVSCNGSIVPVTELRLSADVSGEIIEQYIVEGQKVSKGDLLLVINPDLIQAARDRASAALSQAKANLASSKAREAQAQANFINAENNYKRNEKLFQQKVISDAEYDNLKATYETAKAELEAAKQTVIASDFSVRSAEATVKEALDNLNRTKIFAPVDGTISLLSTEKGERVVGTAQMTGTEILRLADLTQMQVTATVNENDIVKVSVNDTAIIDVDAYRGRKFKGVVTQIAQSAKGLASTTQVSTDQVKEFDVKVLILRESYEDLIKEESPHLSPFRSGMSATVEIQTYKNSNTLSIPIQSVTSRELKSDEKEKSEEKNFIVFVYSNGKVSERKVKTGIQDNNYISINDGLKEGEEVVTFPYSAITKTLKDGMEVKVVDQNELFSK
jgi:HlyD family secretion protein